MVLGDEALDHPGIALMKEEYFLGIAQLFKTALNMADGSNGAEEPVQNFQHEIKLDVIHSLLKINSKGLTQYTGIYFLMRKAFA